MQKSDKIDIKTPAPAGTAESSSVTANTGKKSGRKIKIGETFFFCIILGNDVRTRKDKNGQGWKRCN